MLKNSAQPLLSRFQYDASPAFRLNATRFHYRKKFIDALHSGAIKVANVDSCDCKSQNLFMLAEQDRFGLPFKTALCLDCGLAFSTPRIAEESLPEYYKNYYHPLVLGTKSGDAKEDLVRSSQGALIFKFLRESIGEHKQKPLRICEIGCASGSNLIEIKELCSQINVECELYGTEFENAHAQKASEHGIRTLQVDVADLSQFGQKFDVIIMSHVFEHLVNLGQVLSDIKKVLAPNAYLYIEVPGIYHLENYDNNFIDYVVHAHMFHFTLESLRHVLARNGFGYKKGTELVQGLFTVDESVTLNPHQAQVSLSIVNYLLEIEEQRRKKPLIKLLFNSLMSYYYKLEHTFSSREKLKAAFSIK